MEEPPGATDEPVVRHFFRVSLTDEDLARLVKEAKATLRPGSTAAQLALTLAFYERDLVTDSVLQSPDAFLVPDLTPKQITILKRLQKYFEDAQQILMSRDNPTRIAGQRWLFTVNSMRQVDGHNRISADDMVRHLGSLALAATAALDNPDLYLRKYLLPMASDRERQEMDEAKIAEMEANARYILKREPATRALMLIGRAIGAHVEDSLLGTVDVNTYKSLGGPALTLGRAVAQAWQIEPVPGDEALRTIWKRLPEKLAGHPAKAATKPGRRP